MEGKVKWYNRKKGYGFVQGNDGTDYFVHFTGLAPKTYIRDEDIVEFEPVENEKGPQAQNVKLIKKASEIQSKDGSTPAQDEEVEYQNNDDEDVEEEADEDVEEPEDEDVEDDEEVEEPEDDEKVKEEADEDVEEPEDEDVEEEADEDVEDDEEVEEPEDEDVEDDKEVKNK